MPFYYIFLFHFTNIWYNIRGDVMKEKIQNYIIIFLVIIIFFLSVTFVFTYINNKNKNDIIMTNELKNNNLVFEQGTSDNVIGPITSNRVIEQITIKDVNINCIGIKFATYDRVNNAVYRISLKENDKYIVKYDFNANSLVNGEYTYFKFRQIHLDKKKNYKIVIDSINVSENNIITIFSNKKTNAITYSLYN